MIEETTGEVYSPEQAFTSAVAGHELFGLPLRQFSTSRKIASQSMGCIAPHLGSLADRLRTNGLYPGAMNDVIIVCWLCACVRDQSEPMTAEEYRDGQFTPERAIRQPALALEKAYAWAETVKITDQRSPEFWQAYSAFMEIMFDIKAADFETKVEENRSAPSMEAPFSPKAQPGHPTSRSSSHGSPGKPAKRARSSGKR